VILGQVQPWLWQGLSFGELKGGWRVQWAKGKSKTWIRFLILIACLPVFRIGIAREPGCRFLPSNAGKKRIKSSPMIGTIINIVAVLVGGILGILFGARLPERIGKQLLQV